MTQNERAEFIQNFYNNHCVKLLSTKGKEYSRNEIDVNSNFKRIGSSIEIDPIKILYVYMSKHWDAITSYVKNGAVQSDEPIESRIADLINYGFILASMIEENIKNNTK